MLINEVKKPLAITMWDSSWIRRQFAGGGFEDWDDVLDELVMRGYDAVRIDVFPHMIANAPDGTNSLRFRDFPGQHPHPYGFAQWGSPWTIYIEPRKAAVEFIKKCKKRSIYVVLATWLKPTEERRNEKMEGVNDMVRIWDETLGFLKKHDCLDNILYTEVLNEYPLSNCNTWLHNMLNTMRQPEIKGKSVNERQKRFYREYIRDVISQLKSKWPFMAFSASSSFNWFFEYDLDMDFSFYDVLDVHIWAENQFAPKTGYYECIFGHGKLKHGDPDKMYTNTSTGLGGGYVTGARRLPGDIHYEDMYQKLLNAWHNGKDSHANWIEEKIKGVSKVGKKWGIPVGCTEGWGTVFWAEHPMLGWDIIKEAGIIAAKLGNRYGYKFNCSSNSSEPQFLRLWRDIDYHKKVTSLIKQPNNK